MVNFGFFKPKSKNQLMSYKEYNEQLLTSEIATLQVRKDIIEKVNPKTENQ